MKKVKRFPRHNHFKSAETELTEAIMRSYSSYESAKRSERAKMAWAQKKWREANSR